MYGAASQIATDFDAFTRMRADARNGDNREENLDKVAQQFESLFIGMMLKQMRQANDALGQGMLSSKQNGYYRDMYDQQVALHLSQRGSFGLADSIRRQLGGESQAAGEGRGHADYLVSPTPRARAIEPAEQPLVETEDIGTAADVACPSDPGFADPAEFISRLRPHAEDAAARLGLPAEALIAQAALETGWGRSVMQAADGRSSHNLFGIKADQRWGGEQVIKNTLEYRDGVAMQVRAPFRAYDSFADSFRDYADFVSSQPRYRDAMQARDPRAYFQALQQAGYATDPNYADKVLDILGREELQTASLNIGRSRG